MWSRFLISALLVISSINLSAFEYFQDSIEALVDTTPQLDKRVAGITSRVFRVAEDYADSHALNAIDPYLIPETHPIKPALDAIFSKKGVLGSTEAMEKAGFKILCHRKGRGLVVASHPALENYLVKTYLNTASHVDWTSWVRRAKGAKLVQQAIDSNPRYERYVKVPRKVIYHIPLEVRGPSRGGSVPREFLLIVEDMMIFDKEATTKMYQKLSLGALNALYFVINESGYSDCHIGNLPFSSDGKIAFIDTEFTGNWPVHPEWLTKWFSPSRQDEWKALLK